MIGTTSLAMDNSLSMPMGASASMGFGSTMTMTSSTSMKSSPLITMKPAPTSIVGTTRSMIMSPQGSIETPGGCFHSPPSLNLGLPMYQTRSRNGTAMTSSSGGVSNRARKLSFDVPSTPESAWVGGSCGSHYSFGNLSGLPGPLTAIAEPTFVDVSNKTFARPATVLSGGVSVDDANFSTAAPSQFYGGYGGMPGFPGMMPYGMPGMPQNGGYMMMPNGQMMMPFPIPYGQAGGGFPAAAAAPHAGDGMRLDLGALIPTSGGAVTATMNNAGGPVTTVMLRNIPLKYNREALLADLDSRGFGCTYDFFYLPIDFHTGNNVGYAFINFDSEMTVARFRVTYDGLQLSADSAKICQVSDAKAQGKHKNVDQYRNSSVMNMEDRYQPVVFENGVRQPFPPPTRSLKPVKPRARPV